jgi:hypothetical protein
LEAILRDGLVPKVGAFTKGSYGDGPSVIPAVFASTSSPEHLERVVNAMVAAISGEVEPADFEEWDVDGEKLMNDALFVKYGALVELDDGPHWRVAGSPDDGEPDPTQAEDDDRYALVPVRIGRILVGEEMMAFLTERGLLPSSINGFVDDDRPATAFGPR